MKIDSWSELEVYQKAFALQQAIYRCTCAWPKDENFSLTDQIRRSSRSIGSNLAEAWAKRRYPAHFLAKLTDADGELQETLHWLSATEACGYLNATQSAELRGQAMAVGRQLGSMINRYESFCF